MTTQRSAERVFSGGSGRAAAADAWLRQLFDSWDIRTASTARLLAGAHDRLTGQDDLVVLVQYDTSLRLFSLEVWESGRTVYGIDDWLG